MLHNLYKHKNFEIVDSHDVIRKNTERSCIPYTRFLPVVMSWKTIVQYHNQNITTDTMHQCSNFSSFTYTLIHASVCVCLYNFTTTTVKIQKGSITTRTSLLAMCGYNHTYLLPTAPSPICNSLTR